MFFNHDLRDEPTVFSSFPRALFDLVQARLDVAHSADTQIEVGLKLTVFGNPYRVVEVKPSPLPDFSIAYLIPWTAWDHILE